MYGKLDLLNISTRSGSSKVTLVQEEDIFSYCYRYDVI